MQQYDLPIAIPQRGGALTADWAASVARALNARRLVAGPGISLDRGPGGTVVRAEAVRAAAASAASGGTPPFTCRHVTAEETGRYEGWEVYLPDGCVSVGAPHEPINPPATRGGNMDDAYSGEAVEGWYRVGVRGGMSGAVDAAYLEAGADGVARDTLVVTVHCKRYAAMYRDGFERFPRRLFWVEAVSANMPAHERSSLKCAVGDTFSAVVGQIRVERRGEGGGAAQGGVDGDGVSRSWRPSLAAPILVSDDAPPAGMDLLYSFFVGESDAPSLWVDRVYLTNKQFTAGGVTFVGNRVDELGGDEFRVGTADGPATSVYLKVDTAKTPPEGVVLVHREAAADGDGPGETGSAMREDAFVTASRGPADIMLLLYRLDGRGAVVTDNRRALASVQVYM